MQVDFEKLAQYPYPQPYAYSEPEKPFFRLTNPVIGIPALAGVAYMLSKYLGKQGQGSNFSVSDLSLPFFGKPDGFRGLRLNIPTAVAAGGAGLAGLGGGYKLGRKGGLSKLRSLGKGGRWAALGVGAGYAAPYLQRMFG